MGSLIFVPPYVYNSIILKILCREQLKLCGLVFVTAREAGDTNSHTDVVEPLMCSVLLGESLLLSEAFVSPLIHYKGRRMSPVGPSFWLPESVLS